MKRKCPNDEGDAIEESDPKRTAIEVSTLSPHDNEDNNHQNDPSGNSDNDDGSFGDNSGDSPARIGHSEENINEHNSKSDQDENHQSDQDENHQNNQDESHQNDPIADDEGKDLVNNNHGSDHSDQAANDSDNHNDDHKENVNVNANANLAPEPKSKPVSSHKLKHQANSSSIHLRVLVNSMDAVSVIGRKGATIARIRDAANVKLNVSDHVPGAPERVINILGSAEYVAKAAGLVVRTLYDEPFDQPSAPDAKSFPFKILIPNQIMGVMIGKHGTRFREIEQASAAKLRAYERVLPNSNDRFLIVNGVADAIHIAVYYLSTTFIANREKYLRHDSSKYHYNPGRTFQLNGGNNHMSMDRRQGHPHQGNPPNRFYRPPPGAPPPMSHGGGDAFFNRIPSQLSALQPYDTDTPGATASGSIDPPSTDNEVIQRAQQEAKAAPPDEELTQKIKLPRECIGSIIGKGGQQIKGIRSFSGSQVTVADSDDPNDTERVITIQGTPVKNQVALYLISTRIEVSKQATGRS